VAGSVVDCELLKKSLMFLRNMDATPVNNIIHNNPLIDVLFTKIYLLVSCLLRTLP
jgi:hypothetical protein